MDLQACFDTKRMQKTFGSWSGAIGIEFASFYNTLGAETTVIELVDRILLLKMLKWQILLINNF